MSPELISTATNVGLSQLCMVVIGTTLRTAFKSYGFSILATLVTAVFRLFFKYLGDAGIFLTSLSKYPYSLILRPFGSILFGSLNEIAIPQTQASLRIVVHPKSKDMNQISFLLMIFLTSILAIFLCLSYVPCS